MAKPLTRIIGLDPGLCNLGWGVIDWDEARLTYVACGTIKTAAADPMGDRLTSLFAGLEEVLKAWRPAEAAVEETFVNVNARSALKLGQARGIALLVPARMGLSVAEYAPNTVKKTVTGTGHADKRRVQRHDPLPLAESLARNRRRSRCASCCHHPCPSPARAGNCRAVWRACVKPHLRASVAGQTRASIAGEIARRLADAKGSRFNNGAQFFLG